jgi:hypothetical protein
MDPGDILTLNYVFNSGLEEDLANLLAARSLIYIKLIQKEEMLPGPSDASHSEDEVVIYKKIAPVLSLRSLMREFDTDLTGLPECDNVFKGLNCCL